MRTACAAVAATGPTARIHSAPLNVRNPLGETRLNLAGNFHQRCLDPIELRESLLIIQHVARRNEFIPLSQLLQMLDSTWGQNHPDRTGNFSTFHEIVLHYPKRVVRDTVAQKIGIQIQLNRLRRRTRKGAQGLSLRFSAISSWALRRKTCAMESVSAADAASAVAIETGAFIPPLSHDLVANQFRSVLGLI